MSADTENRIEELLERLLASEDGEETQLEEYCCAHPDLASVLRERFKIVVQLRRHLKGLGSAVTEEIPDRVGRFRILGELGRGGMGVVYRAHDPELDREVAVKVVRVGWLGDERRRERFLREIRVSARLRHPGLLPVFEVGTERDCAFYATELVEGASLHEVIRGFSKGVASAAELSEDTWSELRDGASEDSNQGSSSSVLRRTISWRTGHPGQSATVALRIARALAYAHEHGVVHRDVKPANVLLARDGRVLLVDFGLAEVDSEASLTETGDFLGTPYYAPPERIDGGGASEDPSCDVWSLGVSLYELLTLTKPFTGKSRAQIFQQILSEEPVPPRRLNAEIPHDLETVVLKALEKDPRYRYSSANELASDLQRFLAGEPVQARRSSAPERVWKWSRREPVKAGLAALVLLAFSTIVASTLWYGERLRGFAGALEERELHAARNLYRADMAAAAMAVDRDDWRRVERLLVPHAPIVEARDLRRFEWHHMWNRGHTGVEFVEPPEPRLSALAVSSAGERFATGHGTGKVLLWSLEQRTVIASFQEHVGQVNSLAFSPDGRLLASGGDDRFAVVIDLETPGVVLRLGPHAERLRSLDFAPDGECLVTAAAVWNSGVGELRAWRTQDWQLLAGPLRLARTQDLRFLSDCRVLVAGLDKQLRLWDLVLDEVTLTHGKHQAHPTALGGGAGSPVVSLAAERGRQGELLAWTPSGETLLARLPIEAGYSAAVSSAAGRIAVGHEGRISLLDLDSLTLLDTLEGHSAQVLGLGFSAGGTTLISAAASGTVGIWDLGASRGAVELSMTDTKSLALDERGERLAAGSNRGELSVWDLSSGRKLFEHSAVGGNSLVQLSRDGRRLFAAHQATSLAECWDVESGQLLWFHPVDGRRSAIALAPDGRWLAVGVVKGAESSPEILLLDALTGEVDLRLDAPVPQIEALTFGPDGTLAAGDFTSGTVLLYSRGSSSPTRTLHLGDGPILWLAFSSDGELLAGNSGGHLIVLELSTEKQRADLATSPEVTSLAFLDGDRRLVTCTRTGRVTFWDTNSWEEVAGFQAHHEYLEGLAVSGDERTLATGAFDGRIRVWRH